MRLLRLALEQSASQPQTQEPTIVMRGPLAEIYRKALDVALAKKDVITGEDTVGQQEGLATETMANDVIMMRAFADRVDAEDAEADELDMSKAPASQAVNVYGVSAAQVQPQTVVDITDMISSRTDRGDFYLILDATGPGANSGTVNAGEEKMVNLQEASALGQALEALVMQNGGKVFKSLAECAAHVMRV